MLGHFDCYIYIRCIHIVGFSIGKSVFFLKNTVVTLERIIQLRQLRVLCALCCRVTAKDASFELRLHLIYLINDILHHWFVSVCFQLQQHCHVL